MTQVAVVVLEGVLELCWPGIAIGYISTMMLCGIDE